MKEEDEIIQGIFPYLVKTLRRRDSRAMAQALILDIGGARGGWLQAFREEGCRRTILLDIEEENLHVAEQNRMTGGTQTAGTIGTIGPWPLGITGDAHFLPLKTGTVDVVVSRNSLHLWTDIPAAMKEVFRVTRPGGAILLGRGFGPDLPDDLFQEIKQKRKSFRVSVGHSGDQTDSPEPDVLSTWLQQAGFPPPEIIPDRKAYWVFARKLI
jgi:ubiquinone/menaquinone biosynthesis C-methylase UbiE